ncbi:MAG: hypothetical protein KA368_13975 [Acidobacteria bacterium]|nr:hypothetical protein [Acidobacteriota bacterium]
MKTLLLTVLIVALYLLHQDFWFWNSAKPLMFGFLPTGLSYHLVYTLVVSGVMWLLVRLAWPAHLESETDSIPRA